MKTRYLFFLYLKTFLFQSGKKNFTFSFHLSFLSLSIGIGSVICAITIFKSFREELETTLIQFHGHLMVFDPHLKENRQSILSLFPSSELMQVSSGTLDETIILSEFNVATTKMRSLSPQDSLVTHHLKKLYPQWFQDFWNPEKRQVILGAELAKNLKVREGDEVQFLKFQSDQPHETQSFQVKGVVKTGFALYDQQLSLTPQNLFSAEEENFLELSFSDPRLAPFFSQILKQAHWNAQSWYDVDRNLFEQIGKDSQSIQFVIFVLLGLACFNLISTLLLSLSDREFDLATWRMLGLGKKDLIKGLFFWISFLVLLGSGLGSVLSWGILNLIALYPLGELQSLYHLSSFPINLKTSLFFQIIGFTWILALLTGLFILKKLLSISPLTGLKGGLHD